MHSHTAALVLLTFVLGCDGTSPPSLVTTLSIVANSNNQSAYAGTTLPVSPRIRVTSDGAPVAGVAVTWNPSGGTVAPASERTDADGFAEAAWTLGSTPGSYTLEATVEDAEPGTVRITATGMAPDIPVVTFEPLSGSGQTGTVASVLLEPLRVRARINGLPVAGLTVQWSAEAGTMEGVSVTDATGIAQASWHLGTVPGSQVTRAILAGSTLPPLAFTATATPASPVKIVAAGGQIEVPRNLADQIRVRFRAIDAYGNVVASFPAAIAVQGNAVTLDSVSHSGEFYAAWLHLTAAEGVSFITAMIPGLATSRDSVSLVARPAMPLVTFDDNLGTLTSRQNGTSSAVDTISAGSSLGWVARGGYASGDFWLSFIAGPAPIEGPAWGATYPSVVWQAFTQPGTYRYTVEGFTGADTATVVVQ